LASHESNVYEVQVQSASLTPQVVPEQPWPVNTAAQSALRVEQSSACCSASQAGAASQARIASHAPLKQPDLISGTWFSGQLGAAAVQLTAPAQVPFALTTVIGSHDDRCVLQLKPVPQSLSEEQNPPSVQMPSEQKQPAAHCASLLQSKPGWVPEPLPVAPEPTLPEPTLPGLEPLGALEELPLPEWSPKYSWQPARMDAVATAIARPTEESRLVMCLSFLWRARG